MDSYDDHSKASAGTPQRRTAELTRVLAIADEVEARLYTPQVNDLRPELVLACGDLPFDYLEYVVTMTNVPLLFVPGNHDPDLRPREKVHPSDLNSPLWAGRWDEEPPGPPGCYNLDGRVRDVCGLRVAGLGGSIRYKPGPNQYTQSQMQRRALRLELRCRYRKLRDDHGVDVLISHAPPLGVGDGDDAPHRGFAAFHRLIARISPRLMIHGHVHPYGRVVPTLSMNGTNVVNVVGHRVLEL